MDSATTLLAVGFGLLGVALLALLTGMTGGGPAPGWEGPRLAVGAGVVGLATLALLSRRAA